MGCVKLSCYPVASLCDDVSVLDAEYVVDLCHPLQVYSSMVLWCYRPASLVQAVPDGEEFEELLRQAFDSGGSGRGLRASGPESEQ